jgi:hypothetical protein
MLIDLWCHDAATSLAHRYNKDRAGALQVLAKLHLCAMLPDTRDFSDCYTLQARKA